ncbi:MAG TPA: MmgE/PrpD family protein [Desulfatiglandales bacterium]|nr:MmgE/PrpD family protein [Desulfatiglandales bacterium]
MDETKELARFVSKVTFDGIPDSAVAKAKELILDQLGCQLAGATLPWSKASYEYIMDNRSQREESTVVTFGVKTIAQDAAFANANFGHGFMGDDTDSVCHAHLGSIIIPAALAMGERERISGKEFMRAVVLGYEVASRIGAAAPFAEGRGFHPGPIFGPFGVAACTGAILGFDENQLLDALGIAGSHSSGLMEYSKSGGTVNRLHSGIAAYGGIRAALLTLRGFRGPATILEGERGFLRAFSGECSLEEITRGLGREFRVLLIDLKAYCCCGTSSASLDALSKITSELAIHPKEIEEITVNVTPLTFRLTGSTLEPKDITSAQFNGRFGIALRLIKGGNSFREYSEENLSDPEILDLMGKIRFILDEDLEKMRKSDNPAKMMVRLADGSVFEATVSAGKGSILNPMTKEEVIQKFRGFASAVFPDDKAEAIVETVEQLHLVDDIHDLTKMLVAG